MHRSVYAVPSVGDDIRQVRNQCSLKWIIPHPLLDLAPSTAGKARLYRPPVRLHRDVPPLQFLAEVGVRGLLVVAAVLFEQRLIPGRVRPDGLHWAGFPVDHGLPYIPFLDFSRLRVDLDVLPVFGGAPDILNGSGLVHVVDVGYQAPFPDFGQVVGHAIALRDVLRVDVREAAVRVAGK